MYFQLFALPSSQRVHVVHGESPRSGTDTHQQTLAAIELFRAQSEVAHYLELGYLYLSDHPDVAEEVRMSANAARMQHTMATWLMEQFMITANHIVSKTLPMVMLAVKNGKPTLISKLFEHVIQKAEQMKTESSEAQNRYWKLQGEVQKNVANVNNKNASVVTERQQSKIDKKEEEQKKEEADRKASELAAEKELMEKEYNYLKEKEKAARARTVEKAEQLTKDNTWLHCAFSGVLAGACLAGAPVAGGIVGAVCMGVSAARDYHARGKRPIELEALSKETAKLEESVERKRKTMEEKAERAMEKRLEKLKSVTAIEKLELKIASLGNVTSLKHALKELGNVDKQLQRIVQFWGTMASVLRKLKEDIEGNAMFVEELSNPDFQQIFVESVNEADVHWVNFGTICREYKTKSQAAIPELYWFLSLPIDDWGKQERDERKNKLIKILKPDAML